jgi:uncharacterized protein (TIGR02300 family)
MLRNFLMLFTNWKGGYVAKPEFGTKRVDPETGKKFYDLNRDPIVSPYTGISYPRSYFESSHEREEDDPVNREEIDTVLEKSEFISLEEGDMKEQELPDLDETDVEIPATDTDFLDETDVTAILNIDSETS